MTTFKRRMSHRFWDLDWETVLPWEIDGIRVVPGTADDATAFMTANVGMFARDADDRFVNEKTTPAKERFYAEMDVFLFQADNKTIGVATAHPTDWSTYYMRSFAVLPEYRERRFATEYEHRLAAFLQSVAGVSRFECETSVANKAMMKLFIAQGYMLTATTNSERWGTLVRFTKFLSEENTVAFRRQFVRVPAIGRQSH